MVLFGAGDPHQSLAERLQEQLGIPTELFDPFQGLTLGRELRKAPPDSAGRFAPLLGILLDELEERSHAIDFLHPRRRPEPPSRRNLYAAAGLAAAVVVLLALVFGWMHRSSINKDIQRLKAESNRLDREVAQATQKVAAAVAIEDWTSQETNWLDELRWLSDEFPSAEQAMVTKLELSGKKGGKIEFDGFALDVNALKKMDRSLDDESHQVVGQGAGEASSRERYSARFDRAVNLKRGER
jgi:Tfp pilus assembly protein PilN